MEPAPQTDHWQDRYQQLEKSYHEIMNYATAMSATAIIDESAPGFQQTRFFILMPTKSFQDCINDNQKRDAFIARLNEQTTAQA